MAALDDVATANAVEGEEDELQKFLQQNANKLGKIEEIYQELTQAGIKLGDLLSFGEVDLRSILQSTKLNALSIGRLFVVLKTTPQSTIYKDIKQQQQQQQQQKHKLVFLTKEEQEYVNQLNKQKDLMNRLEFEHKTEIKTFSEKCIAQRKEINETFDQLIEIITNKKQSILDEFNNNVNKKELSLTNNLKIIESNNIKLKECESSMHEYLMKKR